MGLNLLRRFEETGALEDRPQSDIRPSLSADRVYVVESVIGKLATQTSTGSGNAHDAGKMTGIPESSI